MLRSSQTKAERVVLEGSDEDLQPAGGLKSCSEAVTFSHLRDVKLHRRKDHWQNIVSFVPLLDYSVRFPEIQMNLSP